METVYHVPPWVGFILDVTVRKFCCACCMDFCVVGLDFRTLILFYVAARVVCFILVSFIHWLVLTVWSGFKLDCDLDFTMSDNHTPKAQLTNHRGAMRQVQVMRMPYRQAWRGANGGMLKVPSDSRELVSFWQQLQTVVFSLFLCNQDNGPQMFTEIQKRLTMLQSWQ